MELHKFLAYLECIRSYAWSFGYSNPALSSVERQQKFKKNFTHLPSHSADVIYGWYLARTANKAAKRMTTFPIVSEVWGHSQKLR